MSTHTLADFDGCGSISGADAASNLDPPPEGMLVPVSGGALRLVELHTLAALQDGVLTLSLEGPGGFRVYAGNSTNSALLLASGQTVTNGQPHTFATADEVSSIWLEAVSNGAATLTFRFQGTGVASNYHCSASVNVTADGFRVQTSPALTSPNEDVSPAYLTGYHGTNFMAALYGATFTPQRLRLVADTSPDIGEIRFRLLDSPLPRFSGFCMNAIAPMGTGSNDDDFSFRPDMNCLVTNATATGAAYVTADLYCKDYGGFCTAVADFISTNGTALFSITRPIPQSTDADAGNYIATHWQHQRTNAWQALYGTSVPLPCTTFPYFPIGADCPPAELGNARANGNYSHGAAGDGLTTWKKYRGYWVGSKDNPVPHHERLDPGRKALLVQVMVEDDYVSGIGTGNAVNPNINWATFNITNVMRKVAQLYSNPEHGAGIDLYWVFTPFTMPVTPHTYNDQTSVPDLYRHMGTIEYLGSPAFPNGQTITGGRVWIRRDTKLLAENEFLHDSTFSVANTPGAKPGITSKFIQLNRDDLMLWDFVKVVLPSRIGIRRGGAQHLMHPDGHAEAHYNASPTFFQGAHVDVVNVAEENYLNNGIHYGLEDYVDHIEWAVAHEIFHLIGGGHVTTNPPLHQQGPLMGTFRPLNKITISSEEILWVNLPNRASILR